MGLYTHTLLLRLTLVLKDIITIGLYRGMPENRYASDIAKKNSASTVFLNRIQTINDIATGKTHGIIGLNTNTGESKQLARTLGELFTDENVLSTVVASYQPPPAPVVPPAIVSGSMSFDGNVAGTTYLSIANDADLRMGTGDFTIEWFQNMTFNRVAARIFQIGQYSGQVSIAVSIEGTSSNAIFYIWTNNLPRSMGNIGPIADSKWIHCAVVKHSGTITLFVNGAVFGTPFSDANNFNDSTFNLIIGAENPTGSPGFVGYTGLLTNFRWTKGTAVYTSPFTTPSSSLTALANTKLLLLASSSDTLIRNSSSASKTVVNNGNAVTWSASNPF